MTLWQAVFGSSEPTRMILTDTSETEILAADTKNKQAVAKIHIANVTAIAAVIDIDVWDETTAIYLVKGKLIAANDAFDIYDEILQVGHSLRAKAAVGDAFHISVLSALPQRLGR